MNDKHLPNDEVLQLVFGELNDSRQDAVRKEVAEDAELAATVCALTTAVAAVRNENVGLLSDEFNDRLRQRMPEILDPAQVDTTYSSFLTRSRTTWRWIMRSPISRVTAAAIFVLAVTSVALWFHAGGTTRAFAFDDFVKPILEAKTVRYKMVTEMKGPPAGTATTMVMMLDATRSRSEIELEMPNQPKHKTVQIWDGSQGKTLWLHPSEKRATVSSSADMPKVKKPNGGDPVGWLRSFLLDARDKPNFKRESLGEKEINGHRVVGFRISSPDAVFRVWGDPKTGSPVRVKMTATIMPNVKMTMSDFEFNVKMDKSLFSVEPPAGYEVTEGEIQQAPTNNSPPEEKDLIEMFRYYGEMSGGRLPDLLDMQSISYMITSLEWCAANQAQTPMAKRQKESAKAQAKLQRGMRFTVLLPEEADLHYAGKDVSLGAVDTPIFWYRPKDSEKYRVIYADLSVRDAETPPSVADVSPKVPEQDLIEMFRFYSESSGGSFPNSLDMVSISPIFAMKSYTQSTRREMAEAQAKLQRGLSFTTSLPKEADSHYAGKHVSFGAVDTPIFWYCPKDAEKYRVIYADLSVRDVDTPPSMLETVPEQDLINTLRDYSELSGGPFPDSLDLQTMTLGISVMDKSVEKLTIQCLWEVCAPGKGKLNEERRNKLKELLRKTMDLQKLEPKGKSYKEQMAKLNEQMLKLVDWEKLAPGKKLNDKQKSKLLDARTQEYMKAQLPKILKAQMPIIMKFMLGSRFVDSLPPEADKHYAGKGVSLGASDTPIFWYRPTDAKKYRVIYADLSVKDASPDEVKQFSEAKAK